MKKLTFAFLAAMILLPVRAEEYVQNGDFSDGIGHWYGNGKNIADEAPDPLAPAAAAHGLLIELRSRDWTKVTQDFRTKGNALAVVITYAFSPGMALSDKADDYANVTHAIDFNAWGPIKIPTGDWMMMLSDLSGSKGQTGSYFSVKPDSANPATFNAKVNHLLSDTQKTITLAFPPGHGTVTILHVSVSDAP